LKKEVKILKVYSLIMAVLCSIVMIILLSKCLIYKISISEIISYNLFPITIFISSILMFISVKKELKYAGYLGIINGISYILLSFTIPVLIILGIFILIYSVKYLKKCDKNKKDKSIVSTMLSVNTINSSLLSFIYIGMIIGLGTYSSGLQNSLFVILILFELFFVISILIFSIMKQENASTFGIIYGFILCITIFNLPLGILEIIMSNIYLDAFQKNTKKKKTNVNTEFGQKVIYDKSFSEDDDEENIV